MRPTAQAMQQALSVATALLFSAAGAAADLEVILKGIHSTDGQALVALHQHRPGHAFPDEAGVVANEARPADTGEVVVLFPDLPPGQYAVAAFHDANGDGELNANFIGMPQEGYGFSNDARGRMGPPKFAAAAVSIGPADEPQRIVVTIRYPGSSQ